MYKDNIIYVVGNSKTNMDNAITNRFNFYYRVCGRCRHRSNIDLSCSSTIRTTDEFVKALY